MPKQVDHDARRREIIEALFRVAARDGLASVSIRTVAAEAGVRAPQVQYYFGTKADLVDGAIELLSERVLQRGLELMREAGDDPSPEVLVRAALTGVQPVDEQLRRDLTVFFALYIAALTDPTMSATLSTSQQFITSWFAELIRQAQQRGDADASIDPEHEARLLLFANTGLTLGVLAGVHTVDVMIDSLEYQLRRVFVSTQG